MRLALAACIALALCACSPAARRYPDAVRSDFMRGCAVQEGATTALCTCSLEGMEKEFSYDQYEDWSRAMRVGADHPMTARVAEITAACAGVPLSEP